MSAPAAPPQLQTRKPTGRVSYPLVLVEGGEKSGKTTAAVILSSSGKVGRTLWFDLGEGSADEYGSWPGARYEVVEHDGTYASILGQVRAAKAEARRAADAGELPTVLVMDTGSDLWGGLADWAANRARGRRKAGPDDEVVVSMDLWNDAKARYRRVMTELLMFPGIVVMIARGGEVAAVEGGRPVEGKKDYKVEGHKSLAYDATVWLRMDRTGPPQIIGARSVHAGIRPGRDRPEKVAATEADAHLLEWLIFTKLRYDPQTADVRDLRPTTGGELTAEERGSAAASTAEQRPAGVQRQANRSAPAHRTNQPDLQLVRKFAVAVAEADSLERLADALMSVDAKEKSGALTGGGAAHVRGLILGRRRALGFASEKTTLQLLDLLKARHVTDPDEQLIAVTRISGRNDLESTLALTEAEALTVIAKIHATGADVDLLTGGPLPPGVDPASVPLLDEGQAPAAENGPAA
ncbi:hypothetical protein [Frankia sp. AgB32]|uniref:hypothetical protein n=1 Tax=Frankia sp. AgB32 TaxID=631119 RepID=UPI00200DC73B|nr:hypothetical protein [Frankia sp. AgB32]MCK9894731.1 hypothetical protein [Frankia sp. AgB32]